MSSPLFDPYQIVVVVVTVSLGAVVIPFVPPAFGILMATWGTVLLLLFSHGAGYILERWDTEQTTGSVNENKGSSDPTPEDVRQEYVDGGLTDEEFEEKLGKAIELEEE